MASSAMLFGRADGSLARDVPAYRQIMPFIMRGKNESAAYFEQELDLTRTQAFIDRWNATSSQRVTLFHVFLWASIQTLAARPRLNRFVAGSRIYQRDGIWISYSAKKAMNDDSPVVVLKKRFEAGRPFAELVEQMHAHVGEGRSDKKSHVDKELSIILALPSFLIRMLVALQLWLDSKNLLPHALIKNDPLYASMFIANVGSLKLEALHHHLYEYGNIPVFAALGRSKRIVTVGDDGQITTKLVAMVKYTYDERVEDGLYCAAALGHLQEILESASTLGGPKETLIVDAPPTANELPATRRKDPALASA